MIKQPLVSLLAWLYSVTANLVTGPCRPQEPWHDIDLMITTMFISASARSRRRGHCVPGGVGVGRPVPVNTTVV